MKLTSPHQTSDAKLLEDGKLKQRVYRGRHLQMLVGQNLGPFLIEKELGSGAMGTVYRASFSKDGVNRRVAIKVIAPGLGDNERIQARFEREAEILKQLKHPNIVRLLATGKYHGRPFYAMEFIEGHALDRQLTKQGRFSWEKVIELGKQVCAALQHAHDNGIIHRDLKPSNLMVDKSGTLKLTDFGIAKDSDMTGLTSANSTVGTAAYMSPEQCRGERDLTPKSDLYALGVVFYELLTGRKPFQAENAMDMFIQHVSGTFERPARIVMDIPPWMDTLVCQLLEKKPEHRPADARTISQALDEVKQRVETHKSLGAEVATKVARRGEGKERDLAQEIVSGKKIRKRRERSKAQFRKQLLAAGGLVLLLMLLTLLLIYALQPPSAESLMNKAEPLLTRGLEDLKKGEYFKSWEAWDEAETKYLNKILATYPNTPEAAKAQEAVDYVKAGQKYRQGLEALDNEPSKNWTKALKNGFDELLKMKSPSAKYFADLARTEMQPYEAPALLKEAKTQANPSDDKNWDEALRKLELLGTRYPSSPEFKEADDLYKRLTLHKNRLQRLRENTLLGDLEWSRMASDFEKTAVAALNDELQGKKDEAKAKWQIIREKGLATSSGSARYIDDPRFRPWIQLAQAKLESMSK